MSQKGRIKKDSGHGSRPTGSSVGDPSGEVGSRPDVKEVSKRWWPPTFIIGDAKLENATLCDVKGSWAPLSFAIVKVALNGVGSPISCKPGDGSSIV